MLDEDVLKIADKYVKVENLLTWLSEDYPDKFSQLIIDLQDMQMSGMQIWEAYEFCSQNDEEFIRLCAARDDNMITNVNGHCYPKVARKHGHQGTIPKIDGAVKSILDEAAEKGTLSRLDEGAEAVNNFFITLLAAMQAGSKFTTNVRINLNTGNGEWGVFAVSLVELLNRDGTPFKAQPQDEVKRMQELQAQAVEIKKDDSGIYDVLENTSDH